MKVEGSVAVIIGAVHGIGKAIVEGLLQRGAKVCFGDVDGDQGLLTLKEIQDAYGAENAFFKKCDITQKSDIQGLVQLAMSKWNRIDIFCPVAGIINETTWELCIGINLIGAIQSVKEVMKHMAKDQGGAGGAIIIMSSVQGLAGYSVFPCTPVYAATKSALMNFSRSMGSDESFAHHGVRFNCLCPGLIDTRMVTWLKGDDGFRYLYHEDAKNELIGLTAARPSLVADALVRCVEDETLKGQALMVMNDKGSDVIKRLECTVTSEDTLFSSESSH